MATQKNSTKTKSSSASSRVVIHMGAGVHELTITDPSSPTLRNHTVSLNGATRKQKEAVVVALCAALGIRGDPIEPQKPHSKHRHPHPKTKAGKSRDHRTDAHQHPSKPSESPRRGDTSSRGADDRHKLGNGSASKLPREKGAGQNEADHGAPKRSGKRRPPRTVSASGHPRA